MQPNETPVRFHFGPLDVGIVRTENRSLSRADEIVHEHMIETMRAGRLSIIPEPEYKLDYSYRVDTVKWNTRVLWNYDKYYAKRLDKIGKAKQRKNAA